MDAAFHFEQIRILSHFLQTLNCAVQMEKSALYSIICSGFGTTALYCFQCSTNCTLTALVLHFVQIIGAVSLLSIFKLYSMCVESLHFFRDEGIRSANILPTSCTLGRPIECCQKYELHRLQYHWTSPSDCTSYSAVLIKADCTSTSIVCISDAVVLRLTAKLLELEYFLWYGICFGILLWLSANPYLARAPDMHSMFWKLFPTIVYIPAS